MSTWREQYDKIQLIVKQAEELADKLEKLQSVCVYDTDNISWMSLNSDTQKMQPDLLMEMVRIGRNELIIRYTKELEALLQPKEGPDLRVR